MKRFLSKDTVNNTVLSLNVSKGYLLMSVYVPEPGSTSVYGDGQKSKQRVATQIPDAQIAAWNDSSNSKLSFSKFRLGSADVDMITRKYYTKGEMNGQKMISGYSSKICKISKDKIVVTSVEAIPADATIKFYPLSDEPNLTDNDFKISKTHEYVFEFKNVVSNIQLSSVVGVEAILYEIESWIKAAPVACIIQDSIDSMKYQKNNYNKNGGYNKNSGYNSGYNNNNNNNGGYQKNYNTNNNSGYNNNNNNTGGNNGYNNNNSKPNPPRSTASDTKEAWGDF